MQWLLAAIFIIAVLALIIAVLWFVRREITKMRVSVDAVIARDQLWDKLGVTPDEVKQLRDGYQQVRDAISELAHKLEIADAEVADAVRVHGPLPVLDQLRHEAQKAERAQQSKNVLTAGEFVLVDAKGNPRARLSMEDGIKPMLALLDEDGVRANYFMLTPTGPVLRLGNRQGEEIMLSLGDYLGESRPLPDHPIVWISISDRNGFNTLIGKMADRPEEEEAGRSTGVSAASIVLSGGGKVLWSTY
jgi:hypothetical protein